MNKKPKFKSGDMIKGREFHWHERDTIYYVLGREGGFYELYFISGYTDNRYSKISENYMWITDGRFELLYEGKKR